MRPAVKQFNQTPPPTVLVTGFNLGEQRTGVDVARELRMNAPDLPIISITGGPYFDPAHITDERQPLLRKPFSSAALAAVIRELQEAG